MKLIKINTDHYIIVDETIQPVNAYYYDSFINAIRNTSGAEYGEANHCWKITHSTQPIEQYYGATDGTIPFVYHKIIELPLSEVKELLEEVDVEWKAINSWEGCDGCDANDELFFINGYQKGYNQALEDNKDKRFSEEDLWKAMGFGYDMCRQKRLDKWGFENFIKSLQPKTEWEVEFIDGKLKLV